MSGKRTSSRLRKNIDYSKLHSGIQQDSDLDEMDFQTDVEREKELCGSFNEGEELDYEDHVNEEVNSESEQEEGEISSDTEESDSEEGEDEELKKCVKSGNLEKLKKILKCREEECKK